MSLRNIDPQGNEVPNSGALTENFPISQGWLRASLRKADEKLSTEYKPYYTFDEVQKLIPGKVYPLDIEIWTVQLSYLKDTGCFWKSEVKIRVDAH